MGTFRDLLVYKKAFGLAMEIFEITRTFPKDEKYSLADQMVRSSRSVCACIGEALRKRGYRAHFIAKISDADMENSETSGWLDFALNCSYIDESTYNRLRLKNEEIGRLLHHMINNPEKY